jgi:hypothetical protein
VLEPGDDGHLKKSPKQRHLTMMSFGASAVPVRSCVLSALSGKVDHGCVHDSLPTGALIVLAMRMFADMVVSTPRLTRSSWRREHGPCAELDVDAVIAEGGSAQRTADPLRPRGGYTNAVATRAANLEHAWSNRGHAVTHSAARTP